MVAVATAFGFMIVIGMTFIIPGFLNAYFGATVDPIMRLIAGV